MSFMEELREAGGKIASGKVSAQPACIDAFVMLYKREVDFYDEVAKHVKGLLEKALQSAGIRALVTSRAKTPNSVHKKLLKRDREHHYQSLQDIYEDIHDLAGVRVSLYLPADQDAVGQIIQQMFTEVRPPKHFPEDRSPDDLPGYVATHYLVQGEGDYADASVEIQVASVLMHAWAEVTHDLAYKAEDEVSPTEQRMVEQLNAIVQKGEATLTQLQKSVEGRNSSLFVTASITKLFTGKTAHFGHPMIYIFDLDDTLADVKHRLHHIEKEPQDWESFFGDCPDDAPIFNVITVARALAAAGNLIYIMTGRSAEVRMQTLAWMDKFQIPYQQPVYMRPIGDTRDDVAIKAEMLKHFLTKHKKEEIAGVFDNRPDIIEMFKQAGLQVFLVTVNRDHGRVPDPGESEGFLIGPNLQTPYGYVVEELNEDGTFAEYKTLLGFGSLQEAEQAYLAQCPEGWANTRVGEVFEVNMKA